MGAAGRAGEERIRVLIADDHALFRRGLHLALDAEPAIEVVAEADDGEAAVARAEELVPDVVLLDVRMPRLHGIDAARRIRASLPNTRIVMLTVSEDEDDLFEAVKAGANGYLLKEIPADEVAGAVRAVARGHSLISPSMASKLLDEFNSLADQASETDPAPGGKRPGRRRGDAGRTASGEAKVRPALSTRELEVLTLVAQGLSNREVAAELFIAENTVKNHMRNILEKLHLHSRMGAVMYAVRQHLVDPHVTDG